MNAIPETLTNQQLLADALDEVINAHQDGRHVDHSNLLVRFPELAADQMTA